MNLEPVTRIIQDIEAEIAILKTVFENCHEQDYDFVPMVVFYSNPETKEMVVAPAHFHNFDEKMVSIAECMHLHAAINASAATVSMASKIINNDITYDALTISILCAESAWNIALPYTITDSSVQWHNEMSIINEFDDNDVDATGKDIINMFYNFTHLDNMAFSPAEILSYLSSKGAAIELFQDHYEYFAVESK